MSNKVYIAIIAVLVGVVGYLGYSVSQKQKEIVYIDKEKNTVINERDGFAMELEQLRLSYDTLSTDNEGLKAEIESKRMELETLQKKVKNSNYDLSKARKEMETLRTLMKGYIHQIDSLQQANDRLMVERDEASQRAMTAEEKSAQLEQDVNVRDQVINKAAILVAGEFVSTGVRERSGGKQDETDRANRATYLKSCFTMRKNSIVKPGTKNVYMLITGPDGKTLTAKGETVTVGGQSQAYSSLRQVDYQNEDIDVCIYSHEFAEKALTKGNYQISIVESGAVIGTTTLVLK
jgi:hypothetical protein